MNNRMKPNLKMSYSLSILAACAVLGATGCGSKAPDAPAPTPPPAPGATAPAAGATSSFLPKASAGIPTPINVDPTSLKNLTASMVVRARKDPFALRSEEQSFDIAQLAQRLSSESGSPEIMYELPEEKDEAPQQVEQLPYRRLSGVLVGDSVLGILVSPGQEGGEILRPGQIVPGTDFRVVSIDQERMILRREGNRLPHEVEVRLEQGDPLSAASGSAAPGAGSGRPGGPGGMPGGPGGFRGGPGGFRGGGGGE